MRELLIWHEGGAADLSAVREAKVKLDVDFQVKPRAARFPEDIPTWEDRVLAIGSRPTFLCDYALTSERTSPEGWLRALRWVLHLEEVDPKATLITDVLANIFGGPVREIPAEEIEARERLRDYQRNRV